MFSAMSSSSLPAGDLWVFGYGSLIWRPDFQFAEQRNARVADRARRFWQGSTDHRGVPGAPGRVVTLIHAPGSVCVGLAFRVEASHVARVVAQLDIREQGGYERLLVRASLDDGRTVDALTYVAFEHNANHLGPATLAAMAAQIRRARGPSGENRDYVLRLQRALRELGVDDAHVDELVAAVVTPELAR